MPVIEPSAMWPAASLLMMMWAAALGRMVTGVREGPALAARGALVLFSSPDPTLAEAGRTCLTSGAATESDVLITEEEGK